MRGFGSAAVGAKYDHRNDMRARPQALGTQVKPAIDGAYRLAIHSPYNLPGGRGPSGCNGYKGVALPDTKDVGADDLYGKIVLCGKVFTKKGGKQQEDKGQVSVFHKSGY